MNRSQRAFFIIKYVLIIAATFFLLEKAYADTEFGAAFSPPGNLHGGSGFSATAINDNDHWIRFDTANMRYKNRFLMGWKPTISAGKRWEFFSSDKFAVVTEFGGGLTPTSIINSCAFVFHTQLGFRYKNWTAALAHRSSTKVCEVNSGQNLITFSATVGRR